MEPLSPKRKWQTIMLATVLLAPAFWALLVGIVASVNEDDVDSPSVPAALALGLAIIPFVFIVLAFMSGHPRAPGAVLRAMGLSILVGIPVSALAADAATGIVAGVGAGGIVALRADRAHETKIRAIGVLVASLYTFALLRTAGAVALLPAPVFPLTAIGIADHLSERRYERASTDS
jgi:hypothetical protein